MLTFYPRLLFKIDVTDIIKNYILVAYFFLPFWDWLPYHFQQRLF